jgi:hypothetical protein
MIESAVYHRVWIIKRGISLEKSQDGRPDRKRKKDQDAIRGITIESGLQDRVQIKAGGFWCWKRKDTRSGRSLNREDDKIAAAVMHSKQATTQWSTHS